jgi:hypothetical protein
MNEIFSLVFVDVTLSQVEFADAILEQFQEVLDAVKQSVQANTEA